MGQTTELGPIPKGRPCSKHPSCSEMPDGSWLGSSKEGKIFFFFFLNEKLLMFQLIPYFQNHYRNQIKVQAASPQFLN